MTHADGQPLANVGPSVSVCGHSFCGLFRRLSIAGTSSGNGVMRRGNSSHSSLKVLWFGLVWCVFGFKLKINRQRSTFPRDSTLFNEGHPSKLFQTQWSMKKLIKIKNSVSVQKYYKADNYIHDWKQRQLVEYLRIHIHKKTSTYISRAN